MSLVQTHDQLPYQCGITLEDYELRSTLQCESLLKSLQPFLFPENRDAGMRSPLRCIGGTTHSSSGPFRPVNRHSFSPSLTLMAEDFTRRRELVQESICESIVRLSNVSHDGNCRRKEHHEIQPVSSRYPIKPDRPFQLGCDHLVCR